MGDDVIFTDMRYFATLIVGIAFLLGSCGTTIPYQGPVGNYPTVEVQVFRHVDSVTNPRNPTWTRHTIVDVTNPSYAPMRVTVNCDPKDPTQNVGTWESFQIRPRTTQQVLLGSEDFTCSVTRE